MQYLLGGFIMNNRQRVQSIFSYQAVDRIPVVHFGFWTETLEKWYHEGHITKEEWMGWADGNVFDRSIGEKLGFDFNWYTCFTPRTGLFPAFEVQDVGEYPAGGRMIRNPNGVIILQKEGAGSIPAEIDHILKDRESWERDYRWRLQFDPKRISRQSYEEMRALHKDNPLGLHCGSLFGRIRDIMGVEGVSYLYADDEELYDEIIDTVGSLCFETIRYVLEQGWNFDFAHFWEDICFKNGPLVIPSVFEEKVGPWYKKITDLLRRHKIRIVSLDCDGSIDALAPIWLENGVSTMFPIEVGTWGGNLRDLRATCGSNLTGVGGMNKQVFSQNREAVDQEIVRLKTLVQEGGYIPCPDHRIPPEASWELVQYYCQRMRQALTF